MDIGGEPAPSGTFFTVGNGGGATVACMEGVPVGMHCMASLVSRHSQLPRSDTSRSSLRPLMPAHREWVGWGGVGCGGTIISINIHV